MPVVWVGQKISIHCSKNTRTMFYLVTLACSLYMEVNYEAKRPIYFNIYIFVLTINWVWWLLQIQCTLQNWCQSDADHLIGGIEKSYKWLVRLTPKTHLGRTKAVRTCMQNFKSIVLKLRQLSSDIGLTVNGTTDTPSHWWQTHRSRFNKYNSEQLCLIRIHSSIWPKTQVWSLHQKQRKRGDSLRLR